MADPFTVTRDGDTLVIRIPIQAPTPSANGKTLHEGDAGCAFRDVWERRRC